jgi:predicted kinase
LDRPWQFPSDHSRFHYFSRRGGDPTREVFNDTTFEVILMSGLPGAGKDTWVEHQATGLPVVSLDELRGELGVTPNEEQGAVAAQATELARGYLRKRQPFIWNATNISRRMREKLIRLFSDYGASTRIVYVETDYEELLRRNRQRARQIPAAAIEHLIEKWEVPDLTEAHRVDVVLAGAC